MTKEPFKTQRKLRAILQSRKTTKRGRGLLHTKGPHIHPTLKPWHIIQPKGYIVLVVLTFEVASKP